MKKPYSKPILLAESFALCEHIAACTFQAHHSAEDMCQFTDAGITMFATAETCSADADSMWDFAKLYGDARNYDNLGAIGLEGQPCYNSFQNYNLLISS